MFNLFSRAALAALAWLKRLVTLQPKNEYERIAFDSLYAVVHQFRKGLT